MQLCDRSNSNSLKVKNPKISKISPKIHIIGNGGWATFKSEGNCTGEGTSTDPYIISDLIINAGGSGSGVIIQNSDVYFKIRNSTIWSSGGNWDDAGINLIGVENGIIENNTLHNNWYGIRFVNSDNNQILNNTIRNCYSGAYLPSWDSHHNVISNNMIIDVDYGLYIYSTNITISNNTMISNNWGITLGGVNHTITDNTLKDNSYGMELDDSHYAKIYRNMINGSGEGGIGLYVIDSDNVKIINNTVKYGESVYAVRLVRCDYSEMKGNIVAYNEDDAVNIASSSHLIFLNNTISFNSVYGLKLDGTYGTTNHNKILNNTIHNNGGIGILLSSSHYNNISNNNVHGNGAYGIQVGSNFNNISNNIFRDDAGGRYGSEIHVTGTNNLIFANYFIYASIYPGRDRGTNNKWNSSSIGNYWSSYTGVDANDDGIGDTPFDDHRNYDYLPIWWDSPQVSINFPNVNDIFELSPNYNISVSRGLINSSWYTIDNGITNVTFTGLNGIIEKEEWNAKGAGPVLLTFYVNDSKGHIGSETVQLIKSYDTPQITINSPTLNEVFGSTSPDFSIIVTDLSPINTTWYTVDGGLTNHTFSGLTGTLNQIAWNNKGTETMILRFYANDSLGIVGFNEVVIWKDVSNPIIAINSPIQNGIFGSTSPEFNISIIEENLVSTWYTLESIAGTFSFSGLTGSINQEIWDSFPQGEINITFYAEDGAGNIGSESVIVIKNIPSPPEIPGYSISIVLLGIFTSIIIFLIKKVRNYKK